MLCAISGEAPQSPVASRKSGTVFEKRLIEAYIQENGKDPVTGEELSLDDLIELKTERIVKPRPPVLTSIPSLLSAFQNEWDALALESYTLKQHLAQLRQELSTALYNNDAAVRVIARLTKERDEARDALSRISLQDRHTAAAPNGDSMQIDPHSLPAEIMSKISATQESLSKTRRKRPIPDGWAGPDDVQGLSEQWTQQVLPSGNCLAINQIGSQLLAGAGEGSSCTVSLADQAVMQQIAGDGAGVNDVTFWQKNGNSIPIIAKQNGQVSIVSDGEIMTTFSSHAGEANALAMHPSGDLVASVGVDGSYVLYDLEHLKEVSKVFSSTKFLSCQFHPDGHLLAAGTDSKQVKIFDVKSGGLAAEFAAPGPVISLSFSENGIWLAVATAQSPNVGIWDLRKSADVMTLDFGTNVKSVAFDYSGQYLCAAGDGAVAVQYYDKSAKSWTGIFSKAVENAKALSWGPQARSIMTLNSDGSLQVMQ